MIYFHMKERKPRKGPPTETDTPSLLHFPRSLQPAEGRHSAGLQPKHENPVSALLQEAIMFAGSRGAAISRSPLLISHLQPVTRREAVLLLLLLHREQQLSVGLAESRTRNGLLI